MIERVDMHMHAGFIANLEPFLDALGGSGLRLFSNTVTPDEYREMTRSLDGDRNVRLGLGLHPWWLDGAGKVQVDELVKSFLLQLPSTRYVGEVGLDFSSRHLSSKEAQLLCFDAVIGACAEMPGKLVSVHCVKADEAVLDALEANAVTESSTIVLHSYSGSSDQLKRAIELGCLFSIGPRMLASKRGREYARIIPEERLLLESDLPAHSESELQVGELEESLQSTLDALARIRSVDAAPLGASIAERSLRLLGYRD